MSVSVRVWNHLKRLLITDPPKTRLTREESLQLAQAYLAGKGDQLREPAGTGITTDDHSGELVWHVCDSMDTRGGNAHLYISDMTGKVMKHWVTPK